MLCCAVLCYDIEASKLPRGVSQVVLCRAVCCAVLCCAVLYDAVLCCVVLTFFGTVRRRLVADSSFLPFGLDLQASMLRPPRDAVPCCAMILRLQGFHVEGLTDARCHHVGQTGQLTGDARYASAPGITCNSNPAVGLPLVLLEDFSGEVQEILSRQILEQDGWQPYGRIAVA